MAGDKNNKDALYRLGEHYEKVDKHKADNYYVKSLELGNRDAADKVFSQSKKNYNLRDLLEDYNFHISGIGSMIGDNSSHYMNNSYER